ncbi:hypothetical protein [Nostoc sp.]|uniref:hypothetical protein n=1 Tax=Nostoc sp. TaxID=1180 RepID=UPI002FF5EBD9
MAIASLRLCAKQKSDRLKISTVRSLLPLCPLRLEKFVKKGDRLLFIETRSLLLTSVHKCLIFS